MKIYLKDNVVEAARKRVARLFDNFENLYVAFSGGKDSTVILNLCLAEAEKRGRLPLPVVFIDQEAEWQSTIDYVEAVMTDPRVKPFWLQVPIRISNSASVGDDIWLECWKPGGDWMRPKHDLSLKENVYGTDRFHKMFDHFVHTMHSGERACLVGGVRSEESPSRHFGLTTRPKFQDITWAKRLTQCGEKWQFTFYPIYDWSYTDVWKFIHDNELPYCKIYDYMWQHGVSPKEMRVSNLHHETAVHSLYMMQEMEPETWNKMTARLGGVHVTRNLKAEHMFRAPRDLPWMFKSWDEYRDYLLEKLIENPEHRALFARTFATYDRNYEGMKNITRLKKVQIATILTNDFNLTKIKNFANTPQAGEFIKWKRGEPIKPAYGQWIPDAELAKAPTRAG